MPEQGDPSRPSLPVLDEAIQRYYGLGQEQARRLAPAGELERLRSRHIPRHPTDFAEYFTTAYFHRPDELRAEIHDADFHDMKILGIEGPAWGAAAIRSALADVAQRGSLLQMLAEIEGEPSIVGASAHLIAIARKH